MPYFLVIAEAGKVTLNKEGGNSKAVPALGLKVELWTDRDHHLTAMTIERDFCLQRMEESYSRNIQIG